MSDQTLFGPSESHEEKVKLAHWLQQVLQITPRTRAKTSMTDAGEYQLELFLDSNYHLYFYQQLPDFIMALLKNDPAAMTCYAPLLYHLAGCEECHNGYLDLYDAMRAAISPQGARPLLGQGTRTLSATPQRMLSHLCQTLITQAEAVVLQARRGPHDAAIAARSLLQLALRISAHITQNSLRRYALSNLVQVATLAEGPVAPEQETHQVHSFRPTLLGASARWGKKIMRRADVFTRYVNQGKAVIHLQSHSLEGTITQHEETLELCIQNLAPALRGCHMLVSVPLGSLIEPVRWRGGNPRAIRSVAPVDDMGTLTMPLGQTDLHMDSPEDHYLLEAMFLLLELHSVDCEQSQPHKDAGKER